MKLAHIAVLLWTTLPILGQTRGSYSPDAIYARSKNSFVTIWTFDVNRAPLGQGSGFIVAKNRVATNYHVLAGSASASVTFEDGSMAPVEAVVAGSAPKDLVIVETETGNRPSLTLGDELQLKVGDTVYAIGTPKGLSASLSSGLVSAFRQDEGQFLIQITASIAPGSSGGPLLNSRNQVVGVTTSRLKDGSFGFAVGASDLQHLLKVPLSIKLQLSDLTRDETPRPDNGLAAVQGLFDRKKYDDARAAFNSLNEQTRSSFDGKLLLCRIEEERKNYRDAIQACDVAIQVRPNESTPYALKALSLLSLKDAQQAEIAAAKAATLSDDMYYKTLLAIVHYSEEKYHFVPKDLPGDSSDTFVLTLLAGAALHVGDYESFRRLRDKVTAAKGNNNGWMLFSDGLAAERDLNWEQASEKYRKCDADDDFIDPICIVSLARVETRQAEYDAAAREIGGALLRYPKNSTVLAQGIFIYLLTGNTIEADRLHDVLKSTDATDESTECLYYYARNQPGVATSHCAAAIHASENSEVAWSNAGYAALDNGDFQSAESYFVKASQLFYASKEKHTVTQELDLYWGDIAAAYYSGDKKDAKVLYRDIKKTYPQFTTTTALKQLPLVWSNATIVLINKIIADFK